jgi:hypothetical protein
LVRVQTSSLPNDASSDAHRRPEIDLLLESEQRKYRERFVDVTYRRREGGNMRPMTDTVNRRDVWTRSGTAGRCFIDERIQIFRSLFDAS